MCLRSLGRHEEAQEASRAAVARAERHIELHPEDARALYLGASALLQLEDRERCLAWAARALAIDPEENTTLCNVACIHAQLGRHDSALELLEKTVRNGFGNKEWIENDPDLSPLKDDPRFESLLQLLAAKRMN
jgi:tetratricopeptide (TPR) repeat protein